MIAIGRRAHATRGTAPQLALFDGGGGRDPDDFGFGSDIDGPLQESEKDVMYLGPLLFALLSWLFISVLQNLPLVPRNENIFSWIPWLILLALLWDLPSEVRGRR